MSAIPQKPPEPSYTEMRQRALKASERPQGLFWGLVRGTLALVVVLVCYVMIALPFLWRLIPGKRET